eukprot:TRINITY_DN942_c0_g3_i1.p2 TRINITY_DN942_c0_g3~~TRINITY_DN942_c0_g3_i1.p2  ORF type:complete len:109 (+),score=28.04 TRINITY_DN942_c0_g3_i1:437-763(+)
MDREQFETTMGHVRRLYSETCVTCCYLSLMPSFLCCLCLLVVCVILSLEKNRDNRVRQYLASQNKAIFSKKGIRWRLEIHSGVWIIIEKTQREHTHNLTAVSEPLLSE